MKKLSGLGLLLALILSLTGCYGGSDNSPPVYEAAIYSDQPADGDIAYDPVRKVYTITNGPSTLYFGFDAKDSNLPEYRAFLDFSLDGLRGGAIVPANASIVSATMEVFINEVNYAAKVPALIDLISSSFSGLRVDDFSSLPLWTQHVNFYPADQGAYVTIDVTPLVREAQSRRLADLQLRILLDLAANNGFVGIEDRRTVSLTAPLLKVRYQ